MCLHLIFIYYENLKGHRKSVSFRLRVFCVLEESRSLSGIPGPRRAPPSRGKVTCFTQCGVIYDLLLFLLVCGTWGCTRARVCWRIVDVDDWRIDCYFLLLFVLIGELIIIVIFCCCLEN